MESMPIAKLYKRISLPEISDPRGSLLFLEEGKHVPFTPRRIFAIYGVAPGARRGGHAHREQHQFLVMLVGSCTVTVRCGEDEHQETLARPTDALYVPPMHWLDLEHFSRDAVCLVAASAIFNEGDYIRTWSEYLHLVKGTVS